MNVCLVHGYLLTGTGSNIYVQNIARQLCLLGHEVHLICQEPHPEALDFVSEAFAADNSTHSIKKWFNREKSQGGAGRCSVYVPDLEGILPVYVYDVYEGFQVKELHLMSKDEIDAYAYLDLKVKATPEGADIKGYLDSSVLSPDSCLPTTGQTSA